MRKLRVLDLFSGIGGFSLGLERTGGFETVAFCEIDPFCRKVLAKHWPRVKQYEDVRELTAERLGSDGISVDVICGGFPCQDISTAGRGAGIGGERSGLWKEYARLIGELRPIYLVVENVAALLGRGLGDVLGDLAEIGFDAEWHCIPAAAIGAPHRRDRIWIVAHPYRSERREIGSTCGRMAGQERLPQGSKGSGGFAPGGEIDVAHATFMLGNGSKHNGRSDRKGPRSVSESGDCCGNADVADSECRRLQGRDVQRAGAPTIIPATFGRHCGGREFGAPWWTEPNVGRVAHGVPHAMDRLKALGNAVVPQIPELIGRAILKSMEAA
jgi:DNA (cytosine-5)-methyltransferase 1